MSLALEDLTTPASQPPSTAVVGEAFIGTSTTFTVRARGAALLLPVLVLPVAACATATSTATPPAVSATQLGVER